jgi:hypothetical protein
MPSILRKSKKWICGFLGPIAEIRNLYRLLLVIEYPS